MLVKFAFASALFVGAVGVIAGPRLVSQARITGHLMQPPICLPGDPPPCNVSIGAKKPGK